MDSVAVHFAFDSPRCRDHILLTDSEKDRRRSLGNTNMIQLAFNIIRDYLEKEGRSSPTENG